MPSSVIKSYHYDPETEILTIEYISGLTYRYLKVPVQVYEEFKYAYSKGRYLNQYIKSTFPYEKVN